MFVTVLLYTIEWILTVILVLVLFLMFFWMWTAIRAKVPFLSIPNSIFSDIEKMLCIKSDSTVYHIGCGNGQALRYLSKKEPNAKYVGIDNGSFPSLLARFSSFLTKSKGEYNVKILQKDFFVEDLSKATHIFVYLYPQIMDDLLLKLDKELKPGTKLVSVSFKFTQKRETTEIDLGRSKWKLARKLYVYDF